MKKKSPLEGLKESIEKMTPEEVRSWAKESADAAKSGVKVKNTSVGNLPSQRRERACVVAGLSRESTYIVSSRESTAAPFQ